MGLGERCPQAQNEDEAMFFCPFEAWVMLAPFSKKLEEREFVVDSGAPVHMLSKKDLSSGEVEALRKPEHGYTSEWASVKSAPSDQKWEEGSVQDENLVHVFCPRIVFKDSSTSSSPARLRSDEEASGHQRDPPSNPKPK